jgi:hypothetical protein
VIALFPGMDRFAVAARSKRSIHSMVRRRAPALDRLVRLLHRIGEGPCSGLSLSILTSRFNAISLSNFNTYAALAPSAGCCSRVAAALGFGWRRASPASNAHIST